MLCEETDTEGALLLAERIREELKATTFRTDLGKLNVTASLGVATYPEHADDSHTRSSRPATRRSTPPSTAAATTSRDASEASLHASCNQSSGPCVEGV